MKQVVQSFIISAMQRLIASAVLPSMPDLEIQLDTPKLAEHGDVSTNLALLLAKPCRLPPKVIAEKIVEALPDDPRLEKVTIAGPGFINFFIKKTWLSHIISEMLESPDQIGQLSLGEHKKILLEFVSANPTGPLHVGHGRGAAFGATIANILKTVGYDVTCEYYVNDAGRQMDILAASIWLRFLSLFDSSVPFPANAYRGDYVIDIAKNLAQDSYAKTHYVRDWHSFEAQLPKDEAQGGDKDIYIDAVIALAKSELGESGFGYFHQAGLVSVLEDIRDDLALFGVDYDTWFSEKTLFDNQAITKSIEALKTEGSTYENEGALWFKATNYGDEKDRVLLRENGQPTYFASDVAYHWHKYQRGFDQIINVFGADHHGYVPRIKAAVTALGHDPEALKVILVQFATLYRGTERVQMSTRSGSFVTLRALREEVGKDAARFFYVLRKPDQHMEFDLELAKSNSQDNPVYYIQYAFARISSVFRQLSQRGFRWDESSGIQAIEQLVMPQESDLILLLHRYHEVLALSAKHLEPHLLAYYLRELATALHAYYNAVTLLCDDFALRNARLCLLKVVSMVLKHGMWLLGISTPESM